MEQWVSAVSSLTWIQHTYSMKAGHGHSVTTRQSLRSPALKPRAVFTVGVLRADMTSERQLCQKPGSTAGFSDLKLTSRFIRLESFKSQIHRERLQLHWSAKCDLHPLLAIREKAGSRHFCTGFTSMENKTVTVAGEDRRFECREMVEVLSVSNQLLLKRKH